MRIHSQRLGKGVTEIVFNEDGAVKRVQIRKKQKSFEDMMAIISTITLIVLWCFGLVFVSPVLRGSTYHDAYYTITSILSIVWFVFTFCAKGRKK